MYWAIEDIRFNCNNEIFIWGFFLWRQLGKISEFPKTTLSKETTMLQSPFIIQHAVLYTQKYTLYYFKLIHICRRHSLCEYV